MHGVIQNSDMSENICSLIKKHHAFYEVLPYYVVLEEKHGSPTAMTRRVHSGFDVDIYGVNIKHELAVPGPDPDYALGYAELQRIAQEASQHHTSDSCSLEVIPFPATAVFDVRDHGKVEAMLRIRIARCGDLDKPAGPAEQRVLEEVEKQLKNLGIARR
jgi:hypothetical protein